MTLATTDEQKALCYVLKALHVEGAEWVRRGAPKADQAIKLAQAKFGAIERRQLDTMLMHGARNGGFEETDVMFLHPPAKEEAAVAAIWCRWDYEQEPPRCGYYFGLWSPLPPFPTPSDQERAQERHIAFVGYRFETPEDDDNHNYYHAQPCRSMGRKDQEIECALPVSSRMPTWPVAARSALELLLCMVTAVYGMEGLRRLKISLDEDPAARQSRELVGAFTALFDLSRPKAAAP